MSQIQFQISSNVTLDELCNVIAEKLRRHPGFIKLQYRLDCKAKTAFTSIQSNEDLEMFVKTVRPLIVVLLLSNGKPSTRPMKPVVVYFDDAASEDQSAGPAPTGNHNKVVGQTFSHIFYYSFCFQGTKSSGSSSKQKPPSSEMDGTEMQQEFIAALHEHWKCDAHTKDPGNPVYCYNPPGTNMCYQLSHNSISYWAVQIVSDPNFFISSNFSFSQYIVQGKGRATVDKKPPSVATQNARPRTQNIGSGLVTDSDHPAVQNQMGPGPTGMPYPYAASPYFFMSPWPAPVQGPHGGNGMLYPSYPQPMPTIPSPAAQACPSPLQPLSDSSHQSHGALPSSGATSPPNSLRSAVPIPDIIPWFEHLEKREKKPPRGANFSDFGPILEGKGFNRISQLTREYIPIDLLQQWLGIEYGTAVLIFQSVEADMRAISAGQSVLPRDS
jgi:hypothetical protein